MSNYVNAEVQLLFEVDEVENPDEMKETLWKTAESECGEKVVGQEDIETCETIESWKPDEENDYYIVLIEFIRGIDESLDENSAITETIDAIEDTVEETMMDGSWSGPGELDNVVANRDLCSFHDFDNN